jgi:hypothetical protein
MKKSQTLYLSATAFHNAQVIKGLADIVKGKGGKFVVQYENLTEMTDYTLYNRSIDEHIREAEKWVKHFEEMDKAVWNQATYSADAHYRKELEELCGQEEMLRTNFDECITFILDGRVYYFQTDRNPLFEYYYSIHKVDAEDTAIGHVYLESLDGKGVKDGIFHFNFFDVIVPQEDIDKAAKALFDYLVSQPTGEVAKDGREKKEVKYYDMVESSDRG